LERDLDRAESEETAVLVAVQLQKVSDEETSESLNELEALVRTAGAGVASSIVQKRSHYDPAALLGKGKIEEVEAAVQSSGASMVIFDNQLTVTQQDRLNSAFQTKVIDRTALILDIFAQHAHTREGRTQVELAQLAYLLPRIRGKGLELSRLGGGIGTRGPGETKLEEDRRRIRRRMRKLEHDLARMEEVRSTQRKQRTRAGFPSVCLVGYTNSGKSSLLNRLTGAEVTVEDQLFSTLDSTTRKLSLPDGRRVVLSDTVGFIRKLPHELVAAFRSTLEVVHRADLLVHVVDASAGDAVNDRMEAVGEVLEDLSALTIPTMIAFNKVDLLEEGQRRYLCRAYPDSAQVSALSAEGVDELLHLVEKRLASNGSVTLSIPAARGDIIAAVYRDGHVTGRILEEENILLRVSLPIEKMEGYRRYVISDGRDEPVIANSDLT